MTRRRHLSFDPTRWLQVFFLVLLAICAGQVVFWILDEVQHTRVVSDRLQRQYEQEIKVARSLVAKGMNPNDVDQLFPDLIFTSGPEQVTVNPEALAALERERHKRMIRFGAEGAFFIVVLVAAMAVIAQTLYQDWQLRRRQQNFLAAVTHEFKSPLASLRLSAETLAMRDPPQPARGRLVTRLVDDVSRLEALIGNILDTARLEEGRVQLQAERVALAPAVQALVDEIGERARAANVTLAVEVPPLLDVQADPVAVKTVLRNLIDNAVKATAAKGGGTVHVLARADGRHAALEVKDDGIGFPPSEAARLFEKFYRPGDELRRTSPGSGLGLYIVKRFMQLTGGDVAASSAGPGQGAAFTVRWPAADRGEP